MRRILFVIFCLLIFKISSAIEPNNSATLLLNTSNTSEIKLNNNYQQFKYQVINFNSQADIDYAYLKRRKKKNDNLMLYVAGGLAVATTTLILVNDPDNFTSNSASSVNFGIAVGGTLACGMIVAKYFIDKRR
jgi:hypothetical protein